MPQVLNLSCNCLSFDFMGTIPDDTSDEQCTVGGPIFPSLSPHLVYLDHLDLKTAVWLWVQNKAPGAPDNQKFESFRFLLVPNKYPAFPWQL